MPAYLESAAGPWIARLERGFPRAFFNSVFVCYSAFFISGLFFNTKADPLKIEIQTDEYPVEAVDFLRVNKIGGNIFPWFDWGEMCIRQLSPANKVFIDGRYETVYSDELINGYFAVLHGRADHKDYLSRFQPTDIMFLHKENPLLERLAFDKTWKLVYSSGPAAIFLKDNENNKDVIKKARNNELIHSKHTPPFYFE